MTEEERDTLIDWAESVKESIKQINDNIKALTKHYVELDKRLTSIEQNSLVVEFTKPANPVKGAQSDE